MRQILCLAMILCVAQIAQAEVVADLYQARTLVSSQTERERQLAARGGLAAVLVKVSGIDDIADYPALKPGLAQAQNYISQFSYESTDEQIETRQGQLLPATALLLKFSPQAVNALLRESGLPLWPANRPSVLVWLVADDVLKGRHLVSESLAYDSLSDAARRRGLPLVSPLFDLQDQIAIDPEELWSLDQAAILDASERYTSDAVLIGRYSQLSDGKWRGDWTLLHRKSSTVYSSDAPSDTELFAAGINQVTSELAKLYSIGRDERPGSEVLAEVSGVDAFGSYQRVLGYLENLDMVNRAELLTVSGDKLLLRLGLDGTQDLLLDTIALDKVLTAGAENQQIRLPGSRYTPRGSRDNPLQFRWPDPL